MAVFDFRSEEEKAVAAKARRGEPFGDPEDGLISELLGLLERDAITDAAQRVPALRDDRVQYSALTDPRIKEIGEALHAAGGKMLMRGAFYRVQAVHGASVSHRLSEAWDGVGSWIH